MIVLKKKCLKISVVLCSLFLILSIVFFALVWNGIIILNEQRSNKYDIKGVDVSSYQGEIDWDILASQNISFAFIKATEGSSFVDENFAYNFEAAQKALYQLERITSLVMIVAGLLRRKIL